MTKLSAPGEEVLSFVIRKESLGEQVTVKTIVDSFQAKPYGWDLASIEVLVAYLVGTSKVTLTVDGNVLKRTEVAAALRNTQKHRTRVVAPQKTFDERKVAAFRKFCTDFFDEANTPKDPLELARHGADKLKGKRDELKATVTGSKYPFVEPAQRPRSSLLDQVVGKPDDWYLTDFNLGDDLLDAKESLIDPIQAFLNGAQQVDLRRGRRHCWPPTAATSATCRPAATRPSRTRWPTRTPSAATGWPSSSRQPTSCAARSTSCRREPGRRRRPRSRDARPSSSRAPTMRRRRRTPSRASCSKVDQMISRVGTESQVALIRRSASSFEESVYPALLDQLAASQQGGGDDDVPPPKQTVSVKTISVPGVSGVLETEEDVDRYLAALRTALVQTLNDGKRISL